MNRTPTKQPPAPKSLKPGVAGRLCALHALQEVLFNNKKLTERLFESLENPQDRKQAQAMVRSILKHTQTIDETINKHMQTPFPSESTARQIMRLGVAQLHYMDGISAHAAVDTSVELIKSETKPTLAATVNAVLRKISREPKPEKAERKPTNLPGWFVQGLEYFKDARLAADLRRSMGSPAHLDVWLRDATLTPQYNNIARQLGPHSWRITDTKVQVTALPGWAEGSVYVQDAAAQLPAQLLTNGMALQGITNGTILDICAAPGGKTIQLKDLCPASSITALDKSGSRLKRMQENLDRCNCSVTLLQADGALLPFADNSFHAVLLDAPCSASGTLRRHPEVLTLRKEKDIAQLALLQNTLLKEAARVVRPGGVLVYATCSVLPREGEQQVKGFLKKEPRFEHLRIESSECYDRADLINAAGELRCFPHHDMDGFFAARLVKKA